MEDSQGGVVPWVPVRGIAPRTLEDGNPCAVSPQKKEPAYVQAPSATVLVNTSRGV